MLTDNERKVLQFLIGSYQTEYSINDIAKECDLAPNGAFKILRKLENEGILKPKRIANIKSYSINFENNSTQAVLEIALMPALQGRVKYRNDDLKGLKDVTDAGIVFGSYITSKKEPDDMDVLFLLEKSQYNTYVKRLNSLKELLPVRIHDVVQTVDDLKSNIMKHDAIIADILKKGIVLWGQKHIIRVIIDVNKR